MLCLKIHLNGRPIAVMGAKKAESLQLTVMANPEAPGAAYLLTHGSVNDAPGYKTTRHWIEPCPLRVGETVLVEVVDVENPDAGTVTAEYGRKVIGEHSELFCSWCGKSEHSVKKLVAGPGVGICDECVKLIQEIVNESAA